MEPPAGATTATAPGAPDDIHCWSCGACVNKWNLFCGKCAYIQPVNGDANYFQLLKLPQTFDIQQAQLDAQFRAVQRTVHPDLFGTKTKQEQELSLSASSKINIAYKVLKNPASRAQYLLQLHGIDAIGESAGSAGVSQDLLMEVMEARELLADPDTSTESLRTLSSEVSASVNRMVTTLSSAFAAGDLRRAVDATVALQYYVKLQAEIDDAMAERTVHHA